MDDRANELIACARGEREALSQLFQLESGRLLGIAFRILRRKDLAEDAVQETFVRIWRFAHQFDPEKGSSKTWINAILRNQALTILRQSDREQPEEPWQLEIRADAEALNEAWTGLAESSELRRCLGQLDDDKRQGILMAYVLGYTHGEIAGRLGAPLGTVKAWVRRGLKALRACLT